MSPRKPTVLVIAAVIAVPISVAAYNAGSYHVVNFNTGSNQRTTVTGDWNPGFWKGECGLAEVVTGISSTISTGGVGSTLHEAQDVLCRADDPNLFIHTPGSCRNVELATHENRSGHTWDWDFGAFKGECANDEYLAGVSQTVSSQLHGSALDSILCCKGALGYLYPDHEPDDLCAAATVRPPTVIGTTNSPPWDTALTKAECGNGFYAVGLSRVPDGQLAQGNPSALLCCPLPDRND